MAIETAGCGGPTRKEPPERDTAAGRATAGRVVPIAIPSSGTYIKATTMKNARVFDIFQLLGFNE